LGGDGSWQTAIITWVLYKLLQHSHHTFFLGSFWVIFLFVFFLKKKKTKSPKLSAQDWGVQGSAKSWDKNLLNFCQSWNFALKISLNNLEPNFSLFVSDFQTTPEYLIKQ